MYKHSPTIEEWPLYRAGSLSEVWSESTTKAPFSYSVVPEDFASGLVPNLEDSESLATDREQKLLVASVDAEPVGFAHICAGPAEVRGEDTECGIIRCLAFVPDFPAVGQLLLESAEDLLADHGYIDAFPLYHGYSFHNYKVGVLSERLAHVRQLFSENGYTPHDAPLTLERRTGGVTPAPIAARVNVEKVPTHAERPNIFVRAFSSDSRIGICRMFSCQAYANLDEFASCCYLRWLGVDQEHRRQGIGHHLLNRALSEAQEEGYKRVILNCRENNIAAVSLYTEVGFRTGDVSSAYVKRL